MFSQSTQKSSPDGDARQPLLGGSSDDLPGNSVVFSVDDGDDDDDDLGGDEGRKPEHTVRFREDVQVFAPPLRSTMSSREAEYDLDDDELDHTIPLHRTPPGHMDSSMPLLVGLVHSSSARDGSIPLNAINGVQDEGDPIDLEELASKRTAGGGILDSVANMANSILGAGIIGLPYAVSQAGFFAGILLLLVLCAVTDWTIRLIVINAKLSGRHSYIDIMDACYGSSGRAAVSFFQFSFAFGGMCAFGIIIGDTIPQVIRYVFPSLAFTPVLSILANRQFVITLCTLCVSYPLSLYRDIHKLSRASGLALVGMLIIVFTVLIEGPQVPSELKGDPSKRFTIINSGIFQATGVISFAFVCHHNSLLIYGSLRTPTLDRFTKVTHISTLMSVVACCTLAISAYVVFTDKTQGNILNNFPWNGAMVNLARFCFGLNMFTTLPLELFVCREVIEQYFFSHESFSFQRHVLFTSVILLASLFVSLVTCDLGVMLEITGGVSATTLAFIFPAACYLKLANKTLPWYSRQRLPAFACAAFGVVVMIISLFIALRKSWTPEGDPKMCR